ncbi:MAG: AAA family ATPase [Polyangiaceae bacterium]|nr:AAA family ATPase [Polyangiaceae bacterium]
MAGPRRAPYLQRLSLVNDRVTDFTRWPFSMPFVRDLELRFESSVTFFVGENGSGKSTLIEALADLCGLPVSGAVRTRQPDHTGLSCVAR